MFEDIITDQKNRLQQTIKANKRFVNLSEIHNNPNIDDFYKNYFNAEVNNWIYEEQIRRKSNPYFNYNSDKIKLHLDELDKILYQIARFDRATLRSTIESAVTTRLNYLLRPRTTLKWFVFRGEPTKAYLEIIKRLSFFKGYDYILSGFIEYVNENKLITSEIDLLSSLEFSNIIEKIDDDYLFSLLPEEFIELIFPIAQIFNYDELTIDKTVSFPIEALIIFLDDKGIEPIKNKLEDLLINKNIKLINGEIFLKQISELLTEIEQNPDIYQSVESDYTDTGDISDTAQSLATDILPDTILPTSEFEKTLADNENSDNDFNEEFELSKGYREMLELAEEISEISKALNEMKEMEEQSDKKDDIKNDANKKNTDEK